MTKKGSEKSLANRSIKSIALDTGAILATLSSKDKHHQALMSFWGEIPKSSVTFVTTEACIVEINYLLPKEARYRQLLILFLEELQVRISPLDLVGSMRINELMDRYADLPMDFADAALVYACERHNITHVLTTDRRDFQIYRPRHCEHFTLLPQIN